LSQPGFTPRLAHALGKGGLSRAGGLLWPEDLPAPDEPSFKIPLYPLPSRVHSAFLQSQPPLEGLPETIIYSPGPIPETALYILAAAWERIAAALGEDCALLVSDLSSTSFDHLLQICREREINAPVIHRRFLTPAERAAAVQHAAVLLQLAAVRPWGDGISQALACGRPLVAEETPLSDKRVGPAGYLTPPGDDRMMASAVITSVVEESVAEQLCQAARTRSAAWGSAGFSARLLQIYLQVSGRTG
jgi:glycosyltransferase involved in cell wall biosynthesis